MHSRRPNRSHLFAALNLKLSGQASLSSENGFDFFVENSDAGQVAGIFLVRASGNSADRDG
jgi:hypothetical protein